MNFKKTGPQVLIFTLTAIVIFILGLLYGKSLKVTEKLRADVEREFKKLQSIKCPAPPPDNLSHIEYITYENKACGISFIIPNYLKEKKIKNQVYELNYKNERFVLIDCSEIFDNLKNKEIDTTGQKLMEFAPMIEENQDYYTYLLEDKKIVIKRKISALISLGAKLTNNND